ncbi:hypothetical protein GQ44DRAFT_723323 [Phaeosphaeriaceae sp. PMI808]|nr:hypothetical protein GQ44DRAFT_723323 [Phaeosphaeriaceae sp. PMI808]
MFSLRNLISHPTLFLSYLIAHTLATPAYSGVIGEDKGDGGVPRGRLATSLTGGEGCSVNDILDIRFGFAEMAVIFQAAVPYEEISQVSREFFGNPTTDHNYTAMVAGNLQRAANYAKVQGSSGPVNSDVHVRCDDPMDVCRYGNWIEGFHTAYNIGNEPHVNFCPDYFNMEPLKKRVDRTAQNQMERDKLGEYYTRATIWARMVMHIGEIGKAVVMRPVPGGPNATKEYTLKMTEGPMNVSVLAAVLNDRLQGNQQVETQTLKYAYGVTRSKLLAVLSTQMPYDAANNPENYALYAQSRYIIREKGFYPTVPIMDFPNEASVLTNDNLQDGERSRFAYFGTPDVVPRPEDMEIEGAPLSSAPLRQIITPTWISLFALAIMSNFVLSSFG